MLQGAVLAGGAQRLMDEQHRPAIVAVLPILQVEQPIDAAREQGSGFQPADGHRDRLGELGDGRGHRVTVETVSALRLRPAIGPRD